MGILIKSREVVKKAFTLVELLVVIAIIGILSGLIIVGMNSSIQSAIIAKAQIFSNSLRDSLLGSLVSEWKFDGTSADGSNAGANDVLDTWTGNNNGTVSATPPIVETGSNCISGSCLLFNGSSSYITVSDNDNLSFTNNIFTFSFWIKPSDVTNGLGVIRKGTGSWEYAIYALSGSTTLRFYSWNSTGSSGVYGSTCVVDLNKWNYFTWTTDGSNSYVYKNGTLCAGPNAKSSYSMSNTTRLVEIGVSGDSSGARYLNGVMDELRIFNAAMPMSKIKEEYYLGFISLLAKRSIDRGEL